MGDNRVPCLLYGGYGGTVHARQSSSTIDGMVDMTCVLNGTVFASGQATPPSRGRDLVCPAGGDWGPLSSWGLIGAPCAIIAGPPPFSIYLFHAQVVQRPEAKLYFVQLAARLPHVLYFTQYMTCVLYLTPVVQCSTRCRLRCALLHGVFLRYPRADGNCPMAFLPPFAKLMAGMAWQHW